MAMLNNQRVYIRYIYIIHRICKSFGDGAMDFQPQQSGTLVASLAPAARAAWRRDSVW
jgi:hypothetical protein